MRQITTIALAGALFAGLAAVTASSAQTVESCDSPQCTVRVGVEDGNVVVTPEVLLVNADLVIIRFELDTDDYVFLQEAGRSVEFKEESREPARRHFSQPFRGGPRLITMTDFNNLHNDEGFLYTVRLQPAGGGQPIEKDPEIRNR